MTSSQRWAWLVSAVASLGALMVLAFVLGFASPESRFYERNFVWLFWVNAVVAALLALVVLVVALRLLVRLQRGKFGSRLLIKLAGIFALVGVLPGLVIYTVSYQFVSRSIEAWFDVQVAGALDAGLALGKGTLDAQAEELREQTRIAADRLSESGLPLSALSLERLREQMGASEVSLVGAGGAVLVTAGGTAALGPPERPAAACCAGPAPAARPACWRGWTTSRWPPARRARACGRWPACRTARWRWHPARSGSCW